MKGSQAKEDSRQLELDLVKAASPPKARAYLDEQGTIVIIGFHAWSSATVVDLDSPIQASWVALVAATHLTKET